MIMAIIDYDTPTQSWKRELINPGMPKEPGSDYYGSACVNAARVGNDPAAFMMTVDPFHGTYFLQPPLLLLSPTYKKHIKKNLNNAEY